MVVKSAGCDWLTMTSKESKIGHKWYEMYTKYRHQKLIEGNQEKPFNNGFYGGVRIDKMSVGHSEQIGYIVIVSGGDAERLYQRLQPAKHKVTRLDLCFDFRFDHPVKLGSQMYTIINNKSSGKKRQFKLIQGSDGGETFYLGSRQSMQFGRVYDKGVQSGKDSSGLLWRAEVEYKKPMSGSIARRLGEVSADEREVTICDTVCEWFADRQVEVFPRGQTSNALQITVEQRTTTADKKLAWLRSQVSPTVVNLIEAGYGRDVLNSLMLDTEAINKCFVP